jgi:hypothetical protein
MDNTCEFVLECVDALRDDLVGIESANCLYIVEEAGWYCVVVEGFIGIRGASIEVDTLLVLGPILYMLNTPPIWEGQNVETYHSFSGSSSNQ